MDDASDEACDDVCGSVCILDCKIASGSDEDATSERLDYNGIAFGDVGPVRCGKTAIYALEYGCHDFTSCGLFPPSTIRPHMSRPPDVDFRMVALEAGGFALKGVGLESETPASFLRARLLIMPILGY